MKETPPSDEARRMLAALRRKESVLAEAISGLSDEQLVRTLERGDLADVARDLVRAELLRRLAGT